MRVLLLRFESHNGFLTGSSLVYKRVLQGALELGSVLSSLKAPPRDLRRHHVRSDIAAPGHVSSSDEAAQE